MKNKTIHIVPVEGSPMGVSYSEIESPGTGGSEKMFLEWAKYISDYGYDVTIYNNPRSPYTGIETVKHKRVDEFRPSDDRDILISFRGYNPDLLNNAKRKLHIGWSTDQYTMGDYKDWYPKVDKFIGISQFHKNDHLKRYGNVASNMKVIDIGCETKQYDIPIEKVEYQAIYCSVPDRGLLFLADWWGEIKQRVPKLKLVITGSNGLWNGGVNDNDLHFRMAFTGKRDIKYLGRIPRSQLIQKQLESEIHLFPCNYDENFCMAAQETQVAGCFALTSNQGALETTNRFGTRIAWSSQFKKQFIDTVADYFSNSFEDRKELSNIIKEKAKEEFDWKKIIERDWLKVLNV